MSARALARMAQPRFLGELTQEEAATRGCTLITTEHGAQQAPEHIRLTLLVDADGVIRDVRFRTAAHDIHIAAYDVMAELCLGKNLKTGLDVTPRQVDQCLRDDQGGAVLDLVATNHPDADHAFYVLGKAAQRYIGEQVSKAASQTLPTSAETGQAKPQPATAADLPWDQVGLFEKVRRIEAVLDTQVRPALAQDGGGLDLIDLKENDLHVQYQGACGSCSSSIGGTMQFITDALNNTLGTSLRIQVSGGGDGGGGDNDGSLVGL